MSRPDERHDEDDRRVLKILSRKALSCPFCPPNRKENKKRVGRYGARKPKSKDVARGRA